MTIAYNIQTEKMSVYYRLCDNFTLNCKSKMNVSYFYLLIYFMQK